MKTLSTHIDWSLPDSERRHAFFDYKISHPHLYDAFQTIMRIVHTPDCGRLGIGVGPTGAGKSTLLSSARIKIERELTDELSGNRSRIPSILVTACPSETHAFSWKVFYLRVLEACREVAARQKIPLEFLDGRPLYRQIATADSVAGLREAVCEVLRQRRPRALFVDEAQHVLKTGSGEHLQSQLDVLKTLADECGVPIILFGTYSLLIQHTMNGQLARRSTTIHFPRYQFKDAKQRESFENVLALFESKVPTKEPSLFRKHLDFLFERSLGCVGILKETLVRAVNLAIEEKSESVTEIHLRRSVLDARKCEAILREILDGERLFAREEEAAAAGRLRKSLEMETPVRGTTPAKGPVTSKKPGTRRPGRDPIGFPKVA